MEHRIALCQLLPEANNSEKNFAVMEDVIKKSSFQNVKLVIFPENFLYGILRDGEEPLAAAKKYQYWLKRFAKLAAKYEVEFVPGTFPVYSGGKIFNSTVFFNKNGGILTEYSKTNLWLSERKEYSSNLVQPQVFKSVLGTTALLICWDIFVHRLFESAVKQGVEWIIIPAFWSINQSEDHVIERGQVKNKYLGFSDSKVIDSVIQARVNEYNIGIIFCNFAGVSFYIGNNGKKQRAVSANRTQIATPLNKLSKKITNKKEKILFVDIPDVAEQIKAHEIYYGRREDVINDYPYK